jgi:hypothetical protein
MHPIFRLPWFSPRTLTPQSDPQASNINASTVSTPLANTTVTIDSGSSFMSR